MKATVNSHLAFLLRGVTPRLSFSIVAALWLAVSLEPVNLRAQFTAGTVLGTVNDPSGAALPDATITATNLETGLTRTVKTDQAGNYTMVDMPLGRYQVKAEAGGFKTAISGPFTLVVDQKLRSDFVLTVGKLSQVLEVKGVGTTLLQTDQSDINQIVEQNQITGLPLNGRDFFSLLLLSNGVEDTSNDQGGATTNVTFSVNGMRPETNSVTLDGIEMSSIREADVDLRPNIDAISEFKVLTSTFSAEYGHTSGGVISIQSRAGTNEFHGSGFEFLRNDALNAGNFFRFHNPVQPEQTLPKAALKQNQFGGTLGGPLKKNDTFFFADYQGYTLRRINEAYANVPEIPFRAGDFSSLLPGTGVYDPATGGTQLFSDPSRATPSNPQGLNIIPLNRMHPLGYALINAVALPNIDCTNVLPANCPPGNYFIRQPQRINGDEAGLRVDHTFSVKDNLFFRYRWNDSILNTADALARPDGPMPGISMEVGDDNRGIVQGGTHRDRNNNAVLSEVHIFSPKLVNEVRLGFHRYHLDVLAHAFRQNLAAKFGLQGANMDQNSSGLPVLYLNAYTSIGGDDFKPLYFRETSRQFNDNVTYVVGKHSLKTGFEYRPRDENNYYALFPAGAFYFYPYRTSKAFSYTEGHELAEVLLGLPLFSFHGRRFSSADLKDRQYSVFLQDDWKVTDKLTLNLGIRYEYATPFFSPSNEISLFDMAQGKLLLAGKDGVSRYVISPDKNNWAPRVGLAYKLNSKTTLRAGYGVFYDPENAKRDDIKFNPPFYRQYTLFDQWHWDQPAPPFTDPGSFPTGYDIFNTDLNLRTAYSEQYSLAVQRELPWGLLFEAAYVGSQAHKLPYLVNFNQSRLGGVPQPFPTLGVISTTTNVGSSVYHSGQFKLERRFGKRMYFLTSYTWSKSIDNVTSANFDSSVSGGVQNIFNPSQNRAVSDWDVPHRVAVSYVYDVPYGKGQPFGAQANPALRAVLGDWQMTGIFLASSGVPGTVTVGSTIPGGDARPNLIGDPNLSASERSPDHWFNTAAFVANKDSGGNLLPGNAGRNIFRGQGYTNFDLGLSKFFPISERVRLQFRTEFFNLSNTPHFALPVRSMSDPSFGRITHTRNPVNFGSTATSYANRMIQFAMKVDF